MLSQAPRILFILILLFIPAASLASNLAAKDALNRARNLINRHKDNQAKPYLDRAIELDPKSTEPRLLRANLEIGMDEPAKALQDLDVVLKQVKSPMAYQYRAEALYTLSQPKPALEDISIALSMASNDEEKVIRLGYRASIYRALKMPNKAVVDLLTALSFKNYPNKKYQEKYLLRRLGNTYMELGEYGKAVDDFTSLLSLLPPTDLALGQTLALRAKAYEKMGRHDLAEADIKKSNGYAKQDFGDFLK
jgi:tetratricopeptide (TPR) repeat protein